jgi:hypothetical protein
MQDRAIPENADQRKQFAALFDDAAKRKFDSWLSGRWTDLAAKEWRKRLPTCLAPNAEITVFSWKEPTERAEGPHVRTFLKRHQTA